MERYHLSVEDSRIVVTDQPERLQEVFGVRSTPDEDDLENEAHWIFQKFFTKRTLTKFEDPILAKVYSPSRDMAATLPCIKETLVLLHFENIVKADGSVSDASGPREIPFIAQYRKERVGFPHILNMHDLWLIHEADRKYAAFMERKNKLASLFDSIEQHLRETLDEDAEEDRLEIGAPKTLHFRLTDLDKEFLNLASSEQELSDLQVYLQTLFEEEIAAVKSKSGDGSSQHMDQDESAKEASQGATPASARKRKHARAHDFFAICRKANLLPMTKFLGLSLDELALGIRNRYGQEPRRCSSSPEDVANEYLHEPFNSVERVLQGMRFAFAKMISVKPTVRAEFRNSVMNYATITTRPTQAGLQDIEDWSPYAGYRFITEKPVNTLQDDQFLWILKAANEKKITFKIDFPKSDVSELRKSIFELLESNSQDEISQAWNEQKRLIVDLAVDEFLSESFRKELVEVLTEEGSRHVKEYCANFVRNIVSRQYEEPGRKRADERNAVNRVVAVSVGTMDSPSYMVALNEDGEVSDWLKLHWLLLPSKRASSREDESGRKPEPINKKAELDAKRKQSDEDSIRKFFSIQRPELIVVLAESRSARDVHALLTELIKRVDDEDERDPESQPGHERVTFVDPVCGTIYASSEIAQKDFPDFDISLRKAIFCARLCQHPQVALSTLFSPSKDILCVSMHPLQSLISSGDLFECLQAEIITAVNRSGLDLIDCIKHKHMAGALKFICGLGPRKANSILEEFHKKRIYQRSDLPSLKAIGPCVAHNCAAFLIIHPFQVTSESDEDEEDRELFDQLDSTRIHPESYPLARKIAMDAFEEGETVTNVLGEKDETKIKKIRVDSQAHITSLRRGEGEEAIKDLNLEDFAQAIAHRFSNKLTTLKDIVNELLNPFKDRRGYHKEPTAWQLFTWFTGEITRAPRDDMELVAMDGEELFFHKHQPLPYTLVENQIVEVTARNFAERVDRRDGSLKPCGVKVKFSDEISGYIGIRNLSDNFVENIEDKVSLGQVVRCRILKIEHDRFSLDLSCKSSDLRGDNLGKDTWMWDSYYDKEAAALAKGSLEMRKNKPSSRGPSYLPRVIDHPSFKNVSYEQAIKLLEKKPPGDAVIRPSSKGNDHLTITWKVYEGVYDNIDILEKDKPQAKSIGNKLFIGEEEFSDIDEILARFVQPMFELIRLMTSQDKFYRNMTKDEIVAILRGDKERTPGRIPYYVIPVPKRPGFFWLSYQPKTSPRHLPFSVSPVGYKLVTPTGQKLTFNHPNSLIGWFKKNFQTFERQPQPSYSRQEAPRGFAGGNTLKPGVNHYAPAERPRPRTPPLPAAPAVGVPVPYYHPQAAYYAHPQQPYDQGYMPRRPQTPPGEYPGGHAGSYHPAVRQPPPHPRSAQPSGRGDWQGNY